MSNRTITEREMERRCVMARAQERMTVAQGECEEMTAAEWTAASVENLSVIDIFTPPHYVDD